jgi:ribonucleoside-triphosphate reductase (thioredoxin)
MPVRLFPSLYEEFIYKSRYSRFVESKGRREEFPETIGRYLNFMEDHLQENFGWELPRQIRMDLFNAISRLENMPSMRALMTAGVALKRDNTAGYNCAYAECDNTRVFDETGMILFCGTGMGFSVEKRCVEQLPTVPAELVKSGLRILAGDSKEGWATTIRQVIEALYRGEIPEVDPSLIRAKGTRLKTFGGRASGPEPLMLLVKFLIQTFHAARGRQLRTIEVHDIMCMIADIVVSGGVRRSAMISLSDLDDAAMAGAKGFYRVARFEETTPRTYMVSLWNAYGEIETKTVSFKDSEQWDLDQMTGEMTIAWYKAYPYRQLANNSAVYDVKPERDVFDAEWESLIASQSGERGIFCRKAATDQAAKNGRRDVRGWFYGTNPCSEIILRPCQFCNLSTSIIRPEDTLDDLLHKIWVATILGTFQSTLTYFPYLREIWTKNTEEERLLGVSLTGIQDHPVLNGSRGEDLRDAWLILMTEQAVETNAYFAEVLGINASVAITCVKPEGTVSQLTDSASGIHTRHSPFYLRSVRQDNMDPVTQFLKDAGVPWEPCNSKPQTISIFYFPMKSPAAALTRNDVSAVDQLETWMAYQRYYCEHKPSCTVSVGDDEWAEVGDWVYENFDELSGVSFLPRFDSVYAQMPYADLTEAEYEEWKAKMPAELDWSKLSDYEKEDMTTATQTLACSAGGCEI